MNLTLRRRWISIVHPFLHASLFVTNLYDPRHNQRSQHQLHLGCFSNRSPSASLPQAFGNDMTNHSKIKHLIRLAPGSRPTFLHHTRHLWSWRRPRTLGSQLLSDEGGFTQLQHFFTGPAPRHQRPRPRNHTTVRFLTSFGDSYTLLTFFSLVESELHDRR